MSKKEVDKTAIAHYTVLVDSNSTAAKEAFVKNNLGLQIPDKYHKTVLTTYNISNDAKITYIYNDDNYMNQFLESKIHFAAVVCDGIKEVDECQKIYDSYTCSKLLFKIYETSTEQVDINMQIYEELQKTIPKNVLINQQQFEYRE